MGIVSGARIVEDGLVFHYDMANVQKSWKGKPTTNLTTDTILQNGWSGSYTLIDSATKTFDVQITQPNAATTTAWRTHYWSVSSYVGQTITISMDVEIISETNCDFSRTAVGQGNTGSFPYHIAGSDAADKMELSSLPTKTHFTWSGVINATGVVGISTWIANVTTNGANVVLRISNVQIEANDFETPFVNGTRSNTQALIDLTGNQTITINDLTYSSDGTFSFDGSNDDMSVPAITLTDWTIGYWFYHDNATTADMTVGRTGINNSRFYHRDTGTAYKIRVHNNNAENIQDHNVGNHVASGEGRQEWHQMFYSVTSDLTVRGWIDGKQTTSTNESGNITTSEFVFDNIGYPYYSVSYYWPGKLDGVMVYNRRLTTDEVLQNYEATRGRYGL